MTRASVARILKPNLDFELLFEGELAASPNDQSTAKIPFFEWPNRQPPTVRDPLAGKPGFDPNLLAYVPVPKGATIQLYIPFIYTVGAVSGPTYYRYWVTFRDMSLAYSNTLQQQGQGSQSHIPYQGPGADDSVVNPAEPRFIINAGVHSVGVHQPAPPPWYLQGGTMTTPVKLSNELALHPEPLVPRPMAVNPVLIAAGVYGVHQQGVTDPAHDDQANSAAGQWFELVAQGDQMLISVDRMWTGAEPATAGSANWGLTQAGMDAFFAFTYGSTPHPREPIPTDNVVRPELGIYLYVIEH
jgi:hypothetical protein